MAKNKEYDNDDFCSLDTIKGFISGFVIGAFIIALIIKMVLQ